MAYPICEACKKPINTEVDGITSYFDDGEVVRFLHASRLAGGLPRCIELERTIDDLIMRAAVSGHKNQEYSISYAEAAAIDECVTARQSLLELISELLKERQ